MELLQRGSLRAALRDTALRPELRWNARCAAGLPAGGVPEWPAVGPALPPAPAPASTRRALKRPPCLPLAPTAKPRRGRQIALDVAEGLAYLHGELRVLHSDLKAA